ncbi:MAG TPA: hypothetical protein VFW23_02070 [Tepidisphaeraceae bacterium]|nr:hypothetical protein [Tepidisphaeraceae bacterium]
MSLHSNDSPANAPVALDTKSIKPLAVGVLSILAIVWGTITVLCGGYLLIEVLARSSGGSMGFGPKQIVQHDVGQVAKMFREIAPVIWLVLGIALLAVGAGGLLLRAWARRLATPWSVLQIIWSCIAVYFAMNVMDSSSIGGGRFVNLEAVQIGVVSGPVAFALLSCILPACFLIFWNRPHVKAAFEGLNSPS